MFDAQNEKIMVLDFCHWSLQPRISCDKISCDNYEIENLISSDPRKKLKGFIAEYFIKPPVSITVHFPVNIEIQYIYVDPVVGRQKSSSVDIFACSKKVKDSWLGSAGKLCVPDEKDLYFYPVGKYFSNNPNLVCFRNSRFHRRMQFDMNNLNGPISCPITVDISHHSFSTLGSTSHLTVRITRTTDASAVAIKSLQIWGQPANSCPRSLQDLIITEYASANDISSKQFIISEEEITCTKETKKNTEKQNKIMLNNVEIPEEFVDPITWEIMSMPTLLPSGKIIDSSTLEKYINTEASWGRCPSDPFTGILFDSMNRPVPNGALKTRIDHFLISNSELLKDVPRIVGTGEDRAGCSISASKLVSCTSEPTPSTSLTSSSSSSSDITQPGTSSSLKKTSRKRNRNSEQCFKNKRTRSEGIYNIDARLSEDTNTHTTIETSGNSGHVDLESDATMSQSDSKHEEKLSNSLDSALHSTLGSFPSFTSFLHKKESDTCRTEPNQLSQGSESMCITCKTPFETGPCYSFPCGHLVCRNCVIATSGNTNMRCESCQMQFSSNEIIRVFKSKSK
ncbi:hypothetical protein ScPMuIL_002975 [Solemya velum]